MISILLPTYNAALTIGNSIKSMLNQTFHEFELLILDDGSTDDTEQIVFRFKDSRISYLKLPHRGLPETLNTGLHLAKYDIIARMDAGDLSLPQRLEQQYSYIIKSSKNTIVASNYAVFKNNKIQYVISSSTDHKVIRKRLALHPDFAHSGVMYYKNFIVDAGMYKNIPVEDYDLWLRIKDVARFYILDEILLFVEYTEGRLSTQNVSNKYRFSYNLLQPYYNDLELEFGIVGVQEQNLFRGWREYFYGSKSKARLFWLTLGFLIIKYPKIILAFITSFLPEKLFFWFKESRVKFRIRYLLQYYSKYFIELRRLLQELTNSMRLQ